MPPKRKDKTGDTGPARQTTTSPQPKRQRASRACDQCRAAREKCDDVSEPPCYPCTAQNRQCTYDANPKKRGVRPGYIRALELTLAWLFEEVPGSEKVVESRFLVNHDVLSGSGDGVPNANRLHKRWRKSTTCKLIDEILSSQGAELPQTGRERSLPSGDEAEFRPNTEISAMEPLKLPSNHWRLLDIYFAYTHSWFPVLERQELLKTVYLYGDKGLSPSDRSASHAELWSALALASFQDATSSKPSAPSKSPTDIYDIARRLIPIDAGPFEFQHATALLLLALVNSGRRNYTAAWLQLGLAKNIIADSDGGPEHTHRRQQQRVNAVLMGCRILETALAMLRKKALRDFPSDFACRVPTDGLEEWQPWTPCEGFGDHSNPAAASRTPAYSLTSFNQLYDIFGVLRKGLEGNLVGGHESHGNSAAELTQAISRGLPFRSFIHGTLEDTGGASVVSACVLRIVFLWSRVILCTPEDPGTDSENTCQSLIKSVSHFVSRFGACAIPPFLASGLAALTGHPTFERQLQLQDRNSWVALTGESLAVWSTTAGTKPKRVLAPMPLDTTPADFTSFGAVPTSIPPQVPMDITSTPTQSGNATGRETLPMGGIPAMHGSSLMDGFQAWSGQTRSIEYYDAVLDDLASIDYTDGADADMMRPQFMANLGFAPGCDLPDFLMPDFELGKY